MTAPFDRCARPPLGQADRPCQACCRRVAGAREDAGMLIDLARAFTSRVAEYRLSSTTGWDSGELLEAYGAGREWAHQLTGRVDGCAA
jgi:hypothetical protein